MESHAHTTTTPAGEFCVEHKHEHDPPGHDHHWAFRSPRAISLIIPMRPEDELERNVASLDPVLARHSL